MIDNTLLLDKNLQENSIESNNLEDISENIIDNNINDEFNEINSDIEKNDELSELEEKLDINPLTDTIPNSLALTVREEYRVTTLSNILNKTRKLSWKIAFSIIVLNFLNMFL